MDEENDMVKLPDGMSNLELVRIVRELIGDDATTDEDLIQAYNSGMFQELIPEVENYWRQHSKASSKRADVEVMKEKREEHSSSHAKRKDDSRNVPDRSEGQGHVAVDAFSKALGGRESDSDLDSVKSSKHHKKKKKKHKKEHRRHDDKQERREKDKDRDKEKEKFAKVKSPEPEKIISKKPKVAYSSSDSEVEEKPKEKEKRKKVVFFDTSSDSDGGAPAKIEKRDKAPESKHDGKGKEVKTGEKVEKPKVHPFYQEKEKTSAEQPNSINKEVRREEEKKKEPKPFSKYDSGVSHIRNFKRWKPYFHRDHFKLQRKYKLKLCSVTCVNLLDMPMIFHDPKTRSKNLASIPLKSGLELEPETGNMIRRLERDKLAWLRKKLNKQTLKSLKHHKRGKDSSDDDHKRSGTKRVRLMDNSSSDSAIYPNKPAHHKSNHEVNDKTKGLSKLSKADKEAELRRRRLEELKNKVDKKVNEKTKNKTRVLPWENKNDYFKPKKEDAKEKAIAEKRKRQEKLRQERLEKEKHKPSVSFQRILKQIDAANKEEANKPKVELKIPKLSSQQAEANRNSRTFTMDKRISVSDVAKEVERLLKSNVNVECPVFPQGLDDLGEYTVKKIAWWLLKNERDPAPEVLFHPEMHDDDEESWDGDDVYEWPDDMSSVNGCVSDPEGLFSDVPHDQRNLNDPDWIDEYCGEASLDARIRRPHSDKDKIDSTDGFKAFLRVKPGTNYAKSTFEVKCFLCNMVLKGQRQFGAHIRSDAHKNSFRNYSLAEADYEESIQPPPKNHRKMFVAKLVEYTLNPKDKDGSSSQSFSSKVENEKLDNAVEANIHQVGRIERVRSDSPGPIVGGDAMPNVEVAEMPIPDNVSIASIDNFDISSDESLENCRVVLRTSGRWNDDLERRWRAWKDEEAKIAECYNVEREHYINNPPRHPLYEEEWLKFWDKRCIELEAEGIDIETYDLQKEWLVVWMERMQEIMLEDVEAKVLQAKRSFNIDKHTLRRVYDISETLTRRKKLKKVRKQKGAAVAAAVIAENTSSLNPLESDNGLDQQYSPALTPQNNPNNAHSKSSFPTPPRTGDEGRRKDRPFNGNKDRTRDRGEQGFRSKSPSSTPLNELESKKPNLVNNDNDNAWDISPRENKYTNITDKNLAKSGDGGANVTPTYCNEPPPPGNDNFSIGKEAKDRLGGKIEKGGYEDKRNHHHRTDREDKRDRHRREKEDHKWSKDRDHRHRKDRDEHKRDYHRERDEKHRRDDKDERRQNHRQEDERRRDRDAEQRRRLDETSQDKDDRSSKSREEPRRRRSKHSRSVSDHSEDDSSKRKRPSRDVDNVDNVSSTSSNTRTLQERLKALREALANEETLTSGSKRPDQPPLPRPKVIVNTLDPNDGPATRRGYQKPPSPEDGEVASDISSAIGDLNLPTQGVSTFIDKDLPGLSEFSQFKDSKPAGPVAPDQLGSNSFGRHLLERKGSFDKPRDNNPPERFNHGGKNSNKKHKFGKNKPWQNDRRGGGSGGRGRIAHGSARRGGNRPHFTGAGALPIPSMHQRSNPFGNNRPPPPPEDESWGNDDSWEPSSSANMPAPGHSHAPGPSFSHGQFPSMSQPGVPEFGNQIPVAGNSHQNMQYYNQQIPPTPSPWNDNSWNNSNYNNSYF